MSPVFFSISYVCKMQTFIISTSNPCWNSDTVILIDHRRTIKLSSYSICMLMLHFNKTFTDRFSSVTVLPWFRALSCCRLCDSKAFIQNDMSQPGLMRCIERSLFGKQLQATLWLCSHSAALLLWKLSRYCKQWQFWSRQIEQCILIEM